MAQKLKSLTLSKETLRHLSDAHAGQVDGGMTPGAIIATVVASAAYSCNRWLCASDIPLCTAYC